jgi:hypothetical protein
MSRLGWFYRDASNARLQQRTGALGVGQGKGSRVGAWAHFCPGLAQDAENLGFVLPLVEVTVKLGFEENQAQGIFDGLHIGVCAEVLFEVDGAHSCDGGFVITALPQDGFAPVGMEGFEIVAPAQVAASTLRVGGAWNLPSAEVLAARGEADRFGGIWVERGHPAAHGAGFVQLLGYGDSFHLDRIGVAGVKRVKLLDGSFELWTIHGCR